MPSARKSVVELVRADEQHEAWVEIPVDARPRNVTEPVVLRWEGRTFVWRTINQQGYFVFAEATVLESRTPAPGIPSPFGKPMPCPFGIPENEGKGLPGEDWIPEGGVPKPPC